MALFYKTKGMKVRNGKNMGKTLYYASNRSMQMVDLEGLASEMVTESTVTRHDLLAVLSSLEQHIVSNLKRGNSIRLGDLGSFHVTFSSKGVEKKEDLKASAIRKVRVRFLPSTVVKAELMVANPDMKFVKWGMEATSENEESNAVHNEG